jgi:hypothetical protein
LFAREQRLPVRIKAHDLAVAGLLLAATANTPAVAQQSQDLIVADAPWTAGEYFIEFRSRRSTYIGHTYIVFGRQDSRGRVLERHVAGLIPEVDAWRGLIAPVRATVREYKDDAHFVPTAIYRRAMTSAEYRRVSRAVSFLNANERQWHAIFQNCNDFGIQIAEALGLFRPPSLLPPSAWVATLRMLNDR